MSGNCLWHHGFYFISHYAALTFSKYVVFVNADAERMRADANYVGL